MDFLQSLGILDIVFIAILAISVLVGLIRGAIREIFSLVGLALAVYLALTFSDSIAKKYVSQFFEDPKISYIVTFIIIIIATIFGMALVNLFIGQLLRASGLSFVNRFFGLIFGVLRGVIICCVLTLIISFVPGVSDKSWWKGSTLGPLFKSMAKNALIYLPDEVAEYFESTKQTVNKVTKTIQDDVKKQTQEKIEDAIDQKMREINDDEKSKQAILESIDSSNNTVTPNNQTPNDNSSVQEPLVLESYIQQ